MKRNQTIDLLKLFFAFGIISIHAQVFLNTNQVLRALLPLGLFRLGVPFFFVSSGYFYYKKVVEEKDTKAYIKKLLKLFLIYEAFDILIQLPFSTYAFTSPINLLSFLWSAFSVGLNGAYWYLTSTVLSLLLLTPLWKKKKIMPLFIVGLILYLVAMTNDGYGAIFAGTFIQNIAKFHTAIWRWPQAGLCMSLLYLSIGAYLYEKQPKVKNLNSKTFVLVLVLLIEAYFLQTNGAYDANCYLSLIIAVPLVFLWAYHHPVDLKINNLGTMSLYVYLLHPFVLMITRFLIPYTNWNYEVLTVIGILVTGVLSYVFTKKKIRS